jgi:ZIP family zinc transporter
MEHLMNVTYYWLAMPAAVMLFGGILTFFWHPSKTLIGLVQHLAAGIILAALMIEVFPEMRRTTISQSTLIISFVVGVIFMYVVKITGDYFEQGNDGKSVRKQFNYGLIIAVFIDAALDGVTIGAGFAAGQKVGLALALGLSVEMLFLAMSLISETIKGMRILFLSVCLSLTILTCATLGYYFLSTSSGGAIAIALAFSAAALIYLVTDELLIEAHEQEEKSYSMLVLFSGFVLFWGISLI